MAAMDDYFDSYDYYNFGTGFDKMQPGKAGHAKHKVRKEGQRYAPSGNIRHVVTKLQNAEKKEKNARKRLNSV